MALLEGELIFGTPRVHEEGVNVVTIKANQKVPVSLPEIKDEAGTPITEFTTAWSNSDPNTVDLVVAEDGLTAMALAKGVVGAVNLSCTVTAAAGAGDYTGAVEVALAVGPPTGGELLFGEPSDI